MTFSVDRIVLPCLNHLLRQAAWSRDRLRPFAGSQVLIETGIADLYLIVDETGEFIPGNAAHPVSVTVTLPSNLPILFVTDRSRIFQSARLAGSVDFAECLGFVFRHLHWDAEADLANFVGDIAAHRIEKARKAVFRQTALSLNRFGQNLSEYATQDSDLVASPIAIDQFNADVSALRDDVARLEKRLQRL